MKICYEPRKFQPGSLEIIEHANDILEDFSGRGFILTLRQLYYQFVARNLIENTQKQYKRLGSVINDARLAGQIDWDLMVDRTRSTERLSHWTSPAQILRAAADSYHVDHWMEQDVRVMVMVEKDALVDVIKQACEPLDVPYLSCRGYMSQSEMWSVAQSIETHWAKYDQTTVVIHLGDHDPSGIDMTRDIEVRLTRFLAGEQDCTCKGEYCDDCDDYLTRYRRAAYHMVKVERIALEYEQIQQYNLPPNPAKESDSRAADYIERFGTESWELDAIDPGVIVQMVDQKIREYIDWSQWEKREALEGKGKRQLASFIKKLEGKPDGT